VSKECKRPKDLKNGETFGIDFSVGKRVRYACVTGFVLQGASEIKCLNNRTWSGRVPTCKGKHKIHGCTHVRIHKHTLFFSNSLIIHHISKHLEASRKYSLTRHTFKSLLGVWRCDKARSFVSDAYICVLHVCKLMQELLREPFSCSTHFLLSDANGRSCTPST